MADNPIEVFSLSNGQVLFPMYRSEGAMVPGNLTVGRILVATVNGRHYRHSFYGKTTEADARRTFSEWLHGTGRMKWDAEQRESTNGR